MPRTTILLVGLLLGFLIDESHSLPKRHFPYYRNDVKKAVEDPIGEEETTDHVPWLEAGIKTGELEDERFDNEDKFEYDYYDDMEYVKRGATDVMGQLKRASAKAAKSVRKIISASEKRKNSMSNPDFRRNIKRATDLLKKANSVMTVLMKKTSRGSRASSMAMAMASSGSSGSNSFGGASSFSGSGGFGGLQGFGGLHGIGGSNGLGGLHDSDEEDEPDDADELENEDDSDEPENTDDSEEPNETDEPDEQGESDEPDEPNRLKKKSSLPKKRGQQKGFRKPFASKKRKSESDQVEDEEKASLRYLEESSTNDYNATEESMSDSDFIAWLEGARHVLSETIKTGVNSLFEFLNEKIQNETNNQLRFNGSTTDNTLDEERAMSSLVAALNKSSAIPPNSSRRFLNGIFKANGEKEDKPSLSNLILTMTNFFSYLSKQLNLEKINSLMKPEDN